MSELVNTLGGEIVHARGINNVGLVVGGGETANGSVAISYDMNTDTMVELGPETAHDVNDRGSAVGDDIIDFVTKHAILYENGAGVWPFWGRVVGSAIGLLARNNQPALA